MTDNPEASDEQSRQDDEAEHSLESIVNPPDEPSAQSERQQASVQSGQPQSDESLEIPEAVQNADGEKTEPEDDKEFPRPEIEPGDPKLEHVVFVLLGVLLTIGVVYQAASVFIM